MKKQLFYLLTILFFANKIYAQKAYESWEYKGTIGSAPIELSLVAGDNWMGNYIYTKYKQKIYFSSEKMSYEYTSGEKIK